MSADFVVFWQHLPEQLNPVALRIGGFGLRWYGLMYLAAFATVYFLVRRRLGKENLPFTPDQVSAFLGWAALGVLAGGRLGYVLFYEPGYYLANPARILSPFSAEGKFTGISGMSYHGGLVGLLLAAALFARAQKLSFWKWADFFTPAIPLGYTFGRIGNFVNGELYGRPTAVPWGMFFTGDPGRLRHPSQLYEAFFEGIFLFCVLWGIRKKELPAGTLTALYFMGYGIVRFAVEFFREPDPQLGFVLGPLTLGQIFCALMILAGAGAMPRPKNPR